MPVVVPALLGLLAWLLGHHVRATLLWAVAVVALLLTLVGVPVDRYLMRLGAFVAHWVGVIATAAIGVGLILAGGVGRLFGVDPLTPRRARHADWQPAPTIGLSRRLATAPFGIEPGRSAGGLDTASGLRGLGRAVLVALGAVAAILLLDLGAGLGWEAVKGADGPVGNVADAINFTGQRATVADPRARLPAMSAYPWADAYFREIQLTPSSYWPFTESRPRRFGGKYVHVDDWSRRSYEPRSAPADAPVVWMFGGSTTWGEGQRDDFTIASDIARIAERAGEPVRVVNYGQRGWTHFQEMILFEQLLAAQPRPDLALFYDGANEINAQSLDVKGVPTHVLVDQYARLTSGRVAREFTGSPRSSPWNSFQVIWDEYATHSAIRKVVGRLQDEFAPPPGAVGRGRRDGGDGRHSNYTKTIQDARNAVDVYERGRRMTEHLASDHQVEPVFLWQPVMVGPAEQWANEHISSPTINISDALDDHRDVFIDGGHTNEAGARVVAERIWMEIEPRVRQMRKS